MRQRPTRQTARERHRNFYGVFLLQIRVYFWKRLMYNMISQISIRTLGGVDMKSMVFCLVLLCMFVLLNVGYAANDVTGAKFYNGNNNFTDTKTEALNGDNLVLWASKTLEKPAYSNTACSLSNLRTQSVIPVGTCDCSKCRANQYCCPTANGYCGCFPMPCPK